MPTKQETTPEIPSTSRRWVRHIAHALRAIVLVAACAGSTQLVQAQEKYPSRPVRIIVAFAPGGPGDIIARVMSTSLAENLGQSVIVDNRAGGDAITGTVQAAKSAPDGYTILQVTSTQAINTVLKEKVPYDLLRDFTPVARTVRASLVLVTAANSPYKTAAELVAAGKSKPGGLTYGSGATGSVGHLSSELFKRAAAINALHVPYKGAELFSPISLVVAWTTSSRPRPRRCRM